MRVVRTFVAVVACLALSAGVAEAQGKPGSSTKQFKFKGAKVEAGMLYSYVRSNLEGTKEGSVLVYVPDKKRVEIFRVTPGVDFGQLLVGEMNWDTYTLKQFELWKEGKDGGRTRQATGAFANDMFTMSVEDPALYRGAAGATTFTIPLVQVPTHIYSLDFVTLGLALRHFADGKGSADVGVLVENLKVGPASPNFLVSAGTANVAFVEEVDRDGIACLKFRIAGPALGDQEGLLWLNKDKGYIQDAEVPVPSSADWPDVKLTFRSAEKIAESDWTARRALELARKPAK
jgi:hypothetical protein